MRIGGPVKGMVGSGQGCQPKLMSKAKDPYRYVLTTDNTGADGEYLRLAVQTLMLSSISERFSRFD